MFAVANGETQRLQRAYTCVIDPSCAKFVRFAEIRRLIREREAQTTPC